MEFLCRGTADGGLNMGDRNRGAFINLLKKYPGVLVRIEVDPPESKKQRGFFEGALVPLVAFYQEGMDHKNPDDLRRVREWLKLEFNAEGVMVHGKMQRVARSSKGRDALGELVEKTVEWLIENYAPPMQVLETNGFKHWRNEVFPEGGPSDYISYLVEMKILK